MKYISERVNERNRGPGKALKKAAKYAKQAADLAVKNDGWDSNAGKPLI